MRITIVVRSLPPRRTTGIEQVVHGLANAWTRLGHSVVLVAEQPVDAAAHGLDGVTIVTLDSATSHTVSLGWADRRWSSFFGVTSVQQGALMEIAAGSDLVVYAGLTTLPYVAVRPGGPAARQVWCALDEWVRHHLSVFRLPTWRSWNHLPRAAVMWAYERHYVDRFDRVWVVNEAERLAFEKVSASSRAELLPPGVPEDLMRPVRITGAPSCIFWGNLGFDPNVEAATWLVRRVWPLILDRRPDATLTVLGARPSERLRQLIAASRGTTLLSDVDDLSEIVGRHTVAAMPILLGRGSRNKVLEAALFGIPVLTTAQGIEGLDLDDGVRIAPRVPDIWARAILDLWDNPGQAAEMAARAQAAVLSNHSWSEIARHALAALWN